MVADFDQASLVAAYEARAEGFDKLKAHLEAELVKELAGRGVPAEVKGRVKEALSFVTKALLGNRYADPLEEIGDKVGLRIILTFERDLGAAEEAVEALAAVLKRESKLDALAYNENGYQGVHLDVEIDQARAQRLGTNEQRAEIQIRTRAQAAWSEVSHEQLYKPAADVPDDLKRRIYRLVALVELFDSEVEQFLIDAESTPGFSEAAILGPLQTQLVRLGVRHAPDREMTRLLAASIVPLYSDTPNLVPYLDSWVTENEAGLKVLVEEAELVGPAGMNPLVIQPELIPILERLDHDVLNLRTHWPGAVPHGWLEDLAERWGKPL